MFRILVSMSALGVVVSANGKDACNAGAESCAERDERQEIDAMTMEMLQTQMQKHRGPGASIAPGANAQREEAEIHSAHVEKKDAEAQTKSKGPVPAPDLVSYDSNGKVCLLCGKPLPERIDREYKEFRTDCGDLSSSTGPNASILNVPAVQLLQHHATTKVVERNGFCQLNFAKSCVDAVANKDYLYWAKSLNLNSSASRANAAWDGRYCKMNGFLETGIVSLQHDFEKTQAKAQELCKTKYAKYDLEKLTFGHMSKAARYDDPAAPSLEEAELLAAWNCAMGELGCDLALCAYSFCAKDGLSTGLYDECEGWHPIKGMPYKS